MMHSTHMSLGSTTSVTVRRDLLRGVDDSVAVLTVAHLCGLGLWLQLSMRNNRDMKVLGQKYAIPKRL